MEGGGAVLVGHDVGDRCGHLPIEVVLPGEDFDFIPNPPKSITDRYGIFRVMADMNIPVYPQWLPCFQVNPPSTVFRAQTPSWVPT